MLSDGMLRGLKPGATTYKLADRHGMRVAVSPKGAIIFRLDYRLNGRRETLTVGRYGTKDGISLLMARERCTEARKAIAEGLARQPTRKASALHPQARLLPRRFERAARARDLACECAELVGVEAGRALDVRVESFQKAGRDHASLP